MISIAPPARDAFLGGSKTPNTPPPGVYGNIPPASTGNTPLGGVAPSGIKQARPNEGSNIGIPYARLVPVSEKSPFGLPTRRKGHPDASKKAFQDDLRKPTDDLRAFTAAFILGKRSNTHTRGMGNAPQYGRFPDIDFSLEVPTRTIVPGMNGVDRFQQLCSFEYLLRYFDHCLAHRAIDMGMGIDFADLGKQNGFVDTVLGHAVDSRRNRGEEFAPPASTMLTMNDFCSGFSLDGSDAKNSRDFGGNQGVFVKDVGPFLRGRCTDETLLDATVNGNTFPSTDGSGRPVTRQGFQFPRNAGDLVAFAALDNELEKIGLTNWRPDGIILSKGVNDPSDKLSDELLDARDGQLFNVRVQGPAITATWTGDPSMEVLPTDKLFVVIVADVWWDRSNLPDGMLDLLNGRLDGAMGEDEIAKNTKTYFELRSKLQPINKTEIESESFNLVEYKTPTKGDDASVLTNFRVRLATSSQFVAHSAPKYDRAGGQQADGEEDEMGRRKNCKSRCGLRLYEQMGEYIVGGWEVGSVLDTSASRSHFSNSGSSIGVRTAPNTKALNVAVGVDWWSADRLHRAFANVEGRVVPRYVRSKTEQPMARVENQKRQRTI